MAKQEDNLNPHQARLDEATSARLAKLRALPVETARLEKLLRSQIPATPSAAAAEVRRRLRPVWWRPMIGVAAMLLMALMIGGSFMLIGPQEAKASAAEMARIHTELVSGDARIVAVETLDQANRAITAQWEDPSGAPSMPQGHSMTCCMRTVKDKRVACVLLKQDGGVPVSVVVGRASDVEAPPAAGTREHAGTHYRIQSSGPLNMVMTERGGRWLCVMGERPVEQLIDLSEGLRF